MTLLNLVRVLRLVLSMLRDLSLSLGSHKSLLEGILLVLNGGLKGADSVLSFLLLEIDHLHQCIELVLALKLILTVFHLILGLSIVNVCLRPQRLCQLIDLQSESNQILLLAVEHVVSNAFGQRLEQIGLFEEV